MDKKANPFKIPMIFIFFALLCFLTSFIMNSSTGTKIHKSLPAIGGLIGPITIKKKNTVFEIDLKQPVNYGSWSSVAGEVLDENQKFLFSFNKEFWAESGYDSEGSWRESDTQTSTKITFKKAGIYYLKIGTENSGDVYNRINVGISEKLGSSLPHLIVGVMALIIGIFLYWTSITKQKDSYSERY